MTPSFNHSGIWCYIVCANDSIIKQNKWSNWMEFGKFITYKSWMSCGIVYEHISNLYCLVFFLNEKHITCNSKFLKQITEGYSNNMQHIQRQKISEQITLFIGTDTIPTYNVQLWYGSNAHESLHAAMTGPLYGGARQCWMFSWHSSKDSQILQSDMMNREIGQVQMVAWL